MNVKAKEPHEEHQGKKYIAEVTMLFPNKDPPYCLANGKKVLDGDEISIVVGIMEIRVYITADFHPKTGDIVICGGVRERELSQESEKTFWRADWAHFTEPPTKEKPEKTENPENKE